MTIEAELADGRILEFPDGTDHAVIQATVKRALGAGNASFAAPKNDLADTLAKIDQMKAPDAGKYDSQGSTTSYLGQQVKKGVAAALGFPVDAIQNTINLLPETARLGLMAAGRYDLANQVPTLKGQPFGGSGTFERLFLTNNDIKPTSPGAEVAGRYVRDLSAAAVPGVGIATRTRAIAPGILANPVNPLPSLGIQGALSTAASTGGEIGRAVAPEPYKDAADLTGVLLGGVAAPGMVANRLEAVNALRSATKPNKVNALADRYVGSQIEDNVRAFPGAAQNLDDALKVEAEIPGLKYRIGQATGVPSLIDMEKRVATAGPEQFNRRVLQDLDQQSIIRGEAQRRLPLLAGKNDVAERLTAAQEQRRSLAAQLPEVEADDVGRVLRGTRDAMKGRYDQIAAEKFAAPVDEAERLGVKLDASGLVSRTQEVLGQPILEYDATNAPAVARRIADVASQTEKEYTGPRLLDASGREYVTARDRPTQVSFTDLKAMREAVNQDIAREAGSPSSNARQRLRALVDIRGEIDRTAQQAPESVRKLYNDAVSWYRDVYAPKFLRGVNLRQSMKDITGEMRVPEEKLAAQYFKPLGSTPMKRFMDLYGDNPQAMRAMESHVLDTYRKYVVRDGVIDPARHEAFMRNYSGPLKLLPETGDNFKSLSAASRMLAERETQLASAKKILDQGQLDALKFEALPDAGIDPRKVNAFLAKNGEGFQDAVSSIYGKKVADDHLRNLREISRAAEIADRGRLPEAATPRQDLSPISMRSGLGFTGRTVFSMIRAITTGRTSAEDVAYTLGAQSASHRITRALIAAEERAISDPETANLIAQSLKQPPTSQAGILTLKNILAKGGMYLIGGNRYAEMGSYRAVPLAIQATQAGREESD